MEKGRDMEKGGEKPIKDMATTKDFLKSIVTKRKLRLGVTAAKAHSAPVSPIFSPAGNVSILDLTWDEDECRSVKKAKQDGSTEKEETATEDRGSSKRLAVKIRDILKQIDTEVAGVAEWAKERNTKKEIKEGISKLTSLMSQIKTREAKAILKTMGGDIMHDGVARGSQNGKEMETRLEDLEKENKRLK